MLAEIEMKRKRAIVMQCEEYPKTNAPFVFFKNYFSECVCFQSSDVFTVAKGGRNDAPNVALIITDANANVAIATTAANAAAVRQQYTYVIVLSVGRDPNVYGLWTLASAPSSQTVYTVNSYRDLTGLLDTRFINSFDGMYLPRAVLFLCVIVLSGCDCDVPEKNCNAYRYNVFISDIKLVELQYGARDKFLSGVVGG